MNKFAEYTSVRSSNLEKNSFALSKKTLFLVKEKVNIIEMKMKFLILTLLTLLLGFSSCKKSCDIPIEDTHEGLIVPDSYVLGKSSGSRGVMRSHDGEFIFKVSFDKGYTYGEVDFDEFAVMNYPMMISCNSHLTKEVLIDYFNHTVEYNITIQSCPDCEDAYGIENWVLVPKFPSSFVISYKTEILL
jgi:hypothetical protein